MELKREGAEPEEEEVKFYPIVLEAQHLSRRSQTLAFLELQTKL